MQVEAQARHAMEYFAHIGGTSHLVQYLIRKCLRIHYLFLSGVLVAN